MQQKFKVVPGKTWGSIGKVDREEFGTLNCDMILNAMNRRKRSTQSIMKNSAKDDA
jgi:hypothetical protein